MTYYFIRHGQSEANAQAILAGWSNSPLTERGRQQAVRVAEVMKESNPGITLIFSSPLSRALDTAYEVADAIGYDRRAIIVLDDLREKSAGTYENMPLSFVYGATEAELHVVGGETAAMFRDRVVRAFNEIKLLSSHDDKVLIVAHSGIFKMGKVISSGVKDAAEMHLIATPQNAQLLELGAL